MDLPNNQIKGEDNGTSFWRQTWGTVRRGVFGSMAAVVFGGMILVASIVTAANPLKVHQFESGETEVLGVKAVVMAEGATESAKIEYYLPYPGMLPDNPLYILKSIRDRIRLTLTMAPEKKAGLQLAYGDKRINAAMFLFDGGKEELAVSTATKAEKYLEQSVGLALKLAGEDKDVKSLLLSLKNATAKHVEILEQMQTKAGPTYQVVLAKTKDTTKSLQEQVGQALVD